VTHRNWTVVLTLLLGVSVAAHVVRSGPGQPTRAGTVAGSAPRMPEDVVVAPLAADVACARLHDAGCAIGDDPQCVASLEFADARRAPGVPSVFVAMARARDVKIATQIPLLTVSDDGTVLCRGIR